MIRAFLTAMSVARIAGVIKSLVKRGILAFVALLLFLIAIVFGGFAGYQQLTHSFAPAIAALIVAGAFAGLAVLLLLIVWLMGRGRSRPRPSRVVANPIGTLSNSHELHQWTREFERTARRLGPVKVSAIAFIVGAFIARRF